MAGVVGLRADWRAEVGGWWDDVITQVKEAADIVQVSGAMAGPGSRQGGGETWADSGCIFKVEATD